MGTSASGLKEFKSTPFDPVFPGVEVHATVVDNILKKDFSLRPKWAAGLESLLVLGFGMLSAFILAWTGAGLEFASSWSHRVGRLAGLGMDVSKRRHLYFTGLTLDGLGV